MTHKRKPRGRRPGRSDTRAQIMDSARRLFGELGYEGVSLRAIAREADVDPALIHHYFDGKPDLFVAAASAAKGPGPAELLDQLVASPREQLGRRTVETFLEFWESPDGQTRFRHMLASTLAGPDGVRALQEFMTKESSCRVCAAVCPDRAALRADLLGGVLISIGLVRYHLQFDAIRAASVQQVVSLYGPIVQHILLGELGPQAADSPAPDPRHFQE